MQRQRRSVQGKTFWSWKTIVRMTLGVLFLILGVLGLFLPILQGILFLTIGIALLADHIPVLRRLRDGIYQRYPRVEHAVARARSRLRALVARRRQH